MVIGCDYFILFPKQPKFISGVNPGFNTVFCSDVVFTVSGSKRLIVALINVTSFIILHSYFKCKLQ